MYWLLAVALSCLLFSGCKSDKPTNSVSFRTTKPAPQNFESWAFEWSRPRVEAGETIQIEVLYPDGKPYFQEEIPPFPAWNPEPSARTEFSMSTNENSPDGFFGKDITIKIKVDKGFLIFSPDGFYTFNFYSGSEETLIESIPATMVSK